MEISNYTLIEVKPSEGKWLTQKAEVSDQERIYSDDLFIGDLDSFDAYREADQEERDAWLLRMEQIQEEPYEEVNDEIERDSVLSETQE